MDISQESAKLNRTISSYPNYKDAGYITQHFIVPLLSQYSLSRINQELNKIEVYVVSIKADLFGDKFIAKDPISRALVSRVIWVCVKGQVEYEDKLKELGMTQDENLKFLDEDTGVLTLKR